MKFTPHDYQLAAMRGQCGSRGFAVFLDPGMGKTSLTLASLVTLRKAEFNRAALVITPIRPLLQTWRQEKDKWDELSHLKVSAVRGTPEERKAALAPGADLYLINPEQIKWLAESGIPVPADFLIVDESDKFKDPSTARFKALRGLLPQFNRVSVLTGTPATEHLQNLWAQIYLLDGGARLGRSLTAFRRAYMVETVHRGGYSTWEMQEGAQERIFAAIADICIRLDGSYLLPERIDNEIRVELPAEAMRAYKAAEAGLQAIQREGVDFGTPHAAAAQNKCRQVANGFVYGQDEDYGRVVETIHTAKADALVSLVSELQGQPLLVGVSYHEDVEIIRKALGYKVPYIGAGIKDSEVNRLIAEWNAGKLPILIGHPASMAEGLNMQDGGKHLCWFSLPWSLRAYLQFNGRILRQGQRHAVTIHTLVAAGTVDETVSAALRSKNDVQQALFKHLEKVTR